MQGANHPNAVAEAMILNFFKCLCDVDHADVCCQRRHLLVELASWPPFFVDGTNCSPLGSGGAGTLPGTAGAAPGSTNPGNRGLVVFKF